MKLKIEVEHHFREPLVIQGLPQDSILQQLLDSQRTIMTELETLNAKLDEAKQAAADERTENLAALAEIKARITANDLSGAIAKADEVIAAIKSVHQTEDDA